MEHPLSEITCENCGTIVVVRRKTRRFCSDRCRKDSHQRKSRAETPINASNSPSERYEQMREFELNMRLSEEYYSTPLKDRGNYLVGLIRWAVDHGGRVKRILTNKIWHEANPAVDRHMCWRNNPTLAQQAHQLCRAAVGFGVSKVIKDGEALLRRLEEIPADDLAKLLMPMDCAPCPQGSTTTLHRTPPMSALARRAYELATKSARISVVRTVRRDAT